MGRGPLSSTGAYQPNGRVRLEDQCNSIWRRSAIAFFFCVADSSFVIAVADRIFPGAACDLRNECQRTVVTTTYPLSWARAPAHQSHGAVNGPHQRLGLLGRGLESTHQRTDFPGI